MNCNFFNIKGRQESDNKYAWQHGESQGQTVKHLVRYILYETDIRNKI